MENAILPFTTGSPTFTRNVVTSGATIQGNLYGDNYSGANPTLATGANSNPTGSGGWVGYHVYAPTAGTFALTATTQTSSTLSCNLTVGVASGGSANVNQIVRTGLSFSSTNTNTAFALGSVTLVQGHNAIIIGNATAQPNITIVSLGFV
jgi:hypothetical protein